MTLVKLATFVLITALLIGCGAEMASKPASYSKSQANIDTLAESSVDASRFVASENDSPSPAASPNQSSIINSRKIIYSCRIGLVVEDYKKFESQLPQLVSNYGGFVASNDTDRRYQNNQSGTWVIRIPVGQYETFLNGVNSIGFAESRTENAQDVTEEYVDVEARIKTKRQLETRILKMLDERNGKLSDVLEIERELSRVREEVERMEGRIRFLKDRTSLATVTINCREEQAYTPAAAPTLASRISQSWSSSVTSLRIVAENGIVAIVTALPWLVILSIASFTLHFFYKRFYVTRRAVQSSS